MIQMASKRSRKPSTATTCSPRSLVRRFWCARCCSRNGATTQDGKSKGPDGKPTGPLFF